MDDDQFWRLIGTLEDGADEVSVARLVDRLVPLEPDEITAFEDHLAAALQALDTPEHFAQPVWDVDEDARGEPIPMSSDVFLYARCAVVAAGQRRFEFVLADPNSMAGTWRVADGELLLAVASRAYELATDLAWEHESPISYETGSNAAAWGDDARREVDGGEANWHPPLWLDVFPGRDAGIPLADEYMLLFQTSTAKIDADPQWRAWWVLAGAARLELTLFWARNLADGHPWYVEPDRVRRGRKRHEAHFTLDGSRFAAAGTSGLPDLVRTDLAAVFDRTAQALQLPGPPAVEAVTEAEG